MMSHSIRIALISAMAFAAPAASAGNDEITIVVTGDTGFSRNHSPVHPKGVLKYGKRPPFKAAIAGIAKAVDGDLNIHQYRNRGDRSQ
ncbi:MAG: hypothetical protein ACI89J_001338 [Hyphomicrobiaceae bacterium]|jgi:hypothetical protein